MIEERFEELGPRTMRVIAVSFVSLIIVVGVLFAFDIFQGIDSDVANLISIFMFGFVAFMFIMMGYFYFNRLEGNTFERIDLMEEDYEPLYEERFP